MAAHTKRVILTAVTMCLSILLVILVYLGLQLDIDTKEAYRDALTIWIIIFVSTV